MGGLCDVSHCATLHAKNNFCVQFDRAVGVDRTQEAGIQLFQTIQLSGLTIIGWQGPCGEKSRI